MLGHCADSQTVCRPNPRASFFKLWKFSPTGALARNHGGFGTRSGGETSIWISWGGPAIDSILSVAPAFHVETSRAQLRESRRSAGGNSNSPHLGVILSAAVLQAER